MENWVIAVNYKVKPECKEEFIKLLKENAKNSLGEPGCLNYEAAIDGDHVFLYEKYKTEEDFNFHITQPHYKKYVEGTKDMLLEKDVKKYIAL